MREEVETGQFVHLQSQNRSQHHHRTAALHHRLYHVSSTTRIFKMAFFGFRAYPTPLVKPMWPFFIAAGVVFYGVNKLQDMAVSTEEASKDPRNPYG